MTNQISPPYPPEHRQNWEDDEKNLLDYVFILLKYKRLIFSIVLVTGLAAVIITLMLPNIYRSETTIIPRQQEKSAASSALSALGALGGMAGELVGLGGGGDVEKFEVVLNSRELTRRVVEKYDLMPELFEDEWDPLKDAWKTNPGPTNQDAYELIAKEMLYIARDRTSDVLRIKFEHEDPKFAKIILGHYLTELSEYLREETLKDAEENKRFLLQQLEKTSDMLLKAKISELLAKEIETETFARAQKYYGFIILDPPVASDVDKKVKPKRLLICVISVAIAIFVAAVLSLFLEHIYSIEQGEKGERLNTLRKYFKITQSRE